MTLRGVVADCKQVRGNTKANRKITRWTLIRHYPNSIGCDYGRYVAAAARTGWPRPVERSTYSGVDARRCIVRPQPSVRFGLSADKQIHVPI